MEEVVVITVLVVLFALLEDALDVILDTLSSILVEVLNV